MPSALRMESYETRLSDGVESVVRMDRRSPLRHAFEVVHGLLSSDGCKSVCSVSEPVGVFNAGQALSAFSR